MEIARLVLGALDTNCWLVHDGLGGPLVVIDPAGDPEVLLGEIGGREVAWVVLTHGHFDHLGAVADVLASAGGRLAVHDADAAWITTAERSGAQMFGFDDASPPADWMLVDGDIVRAGEVELEVIHTPGHTPGCICLLAGGHLFSGDTLFAGSVGRTDFPRGDSSSLRQSIASRLALLEDDVVVHPGHGPDTTIARERRINPFFPRV